VEKCVGAIQQICGIPKMVGQRSEEACGKMSKARKGQLQKADGAGPKLD